ncbi:MAG: hypothetical protein [Caudoviricetes sp.]|nr:MAG: hypothetical protein [Caudoviricetes sp.]
MKTMTVYANTKGERYIIRYYKLGTWTVEEEATGNIERMLNYQLLEFVKVFKLRKVK